MPDPGLGTPGYDPTKEATNQTEAAKDSEHEATDLLREVESLVQSEPVILAVIGKYKIFDEYYINGYPNYQPYSREIKQALNDTLYRHLDPEGIYNGSTYKAAQAMRKLGNEDTYIRIMHLQNQLYRHYATIPTTEIGDDWFLDYIGSGNILSPNEKNNMEKYGQLTPPNVQRQTANDPESEIKHRELLIEKAGANLIKENSLLDWLNGFGNMRSRYINPTKRQRQLSGYTDPDDAYSPGMARESLGYFTTEQHSYLDNLAFCIAAGVFRDNVFGPSAFMLLPETQESFPDSFEMIVKIYRDRLGSSATFEQRREELDGLLS